MANIWKMFNHLKTLQFYDLNFRYLMLLLHKKPFNIVFASAIKCFYSHVGIILLKIYNNLPFHHSTIFTYTL